jgi:hypothetical protein
MEAEETPLLTTVARKRLVNTQQAGEQDLAVYWFVVGKVGSVIVVIVLCTYYFMFEFYCIVLYTSYFIVSTFYCIMYVLFYVWVLLYCVVYVLLYCVYFLLYYVRIILCLRFIVLCCTTV